MLFFYIRHGDPIYEPDSLTELGLKQAEAVAKRLSLYGIDRIYSSTSNRAILTAKPTSEYVKKEIVTLDFANEKYAVNEFVSKKNGAWLFSDEVTRNIFADESVISLGFNWYEHPEFTKCRSGVDRIYNESFEFFKNLGYEHIRYTGKYKILKSNNERVAFFAHQGFGMAFLSIILDIQYPIFANHFDMCHSGITVIDFKEIDGYAIPKVLTLSSDSHLYKEGLPLKYNHYINF